MTTEPPSKKCQPHCSLSFKRIHLKFCKCVILTVYFVFSSFLVICFWSFTEIMVDQKEAIEKKIAFFIYHKYGFHRHFILRVCGESQIWHLTLEDIHYIDLNLTVINAKKFCYLLAFTHAYLQKFYSYFQTDIRFTITDPRILSYTNFIYILLLKIKRML